MRLQYSVPPAYVKPHNSRLLCVPAKHDRFVIDWKGGRPDGVDTQELYEKDWPVERFDHYRLTPEQADQCVMAAMALTQDGWYRFAKRLVEGETSCSPVSAPASPD